MCDELKSKPIESWMWENLSCEMLSVCVCEYCDNELKITTFNECFVLISFLVVSASHSFKYNFHMFVERKRNDERRQRVSKKTEREGEWAGSAFVMLYSSYCMYSQAMFNFVTFNRLFSVCVRVCATQSIQIDIWCECIILFM